MKKVLRTILTGAILIACGEGKHTPIATAAAASGSNTAETTTTVAATTTSTVAPAAEEKKEDFSKAMTLIANSDCLTCHKINEKVIGPAYKEVAKKYDKTPPSVLKKSLLKGDYGRPMILKFGDRYHLVAGNTRLCTAAALGMTPKVLIAEV